MAFIQNEKLFSRKWFYAYSLMVLGSFIMTAGYAFFISPNKIVPGGVYGLAIVAHYLTKGVFSFAPNGLPIGLVGLVLNIPLTIIGIRILNAGQCLSNLMISLPFAKMSSPNRMIIPTICAYSRNLSLGLRRVTIS